MSANTLYEALSVPGPSDVDPGRTQKSSNSADTIDNDRVVIDLYGALAHCVSADQEDIGRTEITKESRETVDRDRVDATFNSKLFDPPTDLYECLGDSQMTSVSETRK